MRRFAERRALLKTQNMDIIRATITPMNVNEYDERGVTWLDLSCMSCGCDNGAVISHILDCGAPIARDNADIQNVWSALHMTAYIGLIECTRVLLCRGHVVDVMVRDDNYTPLELALRASEIECARLLMDYGAQLDKVDTNTIIPTWATAFVVGRERARSASIHLMGALRRKQGGREIRYLIPLIGQWVWSMRGCNK
jgi:hypothetical protein